MKKLDKGDKIIIASVILAIGIAVSSYFIANPKSEMEQCIEAYLKYDPAYKEYEALISCEIIARGK